MITYFRDDQPICTKVQSNVKIAWIDETSLIHSSKVVEDDTKPANPFEYIFG